MSNTVRTGEVDDSLLNSVRKLVSVNAANRAAIADTGMGRLILTPALRVDGNNDQNIEEKQEVSIPDTRETSRVLVLEPAKRSDRAGLEATIAELEVAVTSHPQSWEADEGETFEEAAWAASAFQSRILDSSPIMNGPPILREDPVDQQEVADDDAVETADISIDEEALRKLVVEIVHQELGGELGERITRNVRKLVRREINRILVSRGLG